MHRREPEQHRLTTLTCAERLRGEYASRVIDRLTIAGDHLRMAIALDTLAYARRLREAGFSESQAEGQAQALAAAMTDTLATKQDLSELDARMDARFMATRHDVRELDTRIHGQFSELETRMNARFAQTDTRMTEFEKRVDIRFSEQAALLDGKLADLERRVTVRMLAGIAAVSALAKLL